MKRIDTAFLFLLWLTFNNLAANAQSGNVNSSSYSVADRGANTFFTGGAPGPVIVGYGRIRPDTGTSVPIGMSILRYRATGVLVAGSAIPASLPVVSGRTFGEVIGPVNTGIAFANPNSSPVTISLYFTDSLGTDFGNTALTLQSGNQTASFLNEAPFNLPNGFVGSLTFIASAPVAVASIRTFTNERGEFLLSSQPIASLDQPSNQPIFIAQFADGSSWKTSVQLLNTTDQTITGFVSFIGEGSGLEPAAAVSVVVNGRNSDSFPYAIPAHATAHLDTSGSGVSMRIGSIKITPAVGSNTPSVQAVVAFTERGVTTAQASVMAETAAATFRSYIHVNRTPGEILFETSAIAITNTAPSQILVSIELFAVNGTSLGSTAELKLAPFGHTAKFLTELFPALRGSSAGPFQGMARIGTASGSIVVSMLLAGYNERGDFWLTRTPVSVENRVVPSTEALFPHIAFRGANPAPIGFVQDGYYPQFVLFSGVAGQSATGVVSFFTQSGEPLSLFRGGP